MARSEGGYHLQQVPVWIHASNLHANLSGRSYHNPILKMQKLRLS